MAQAPYEPLDQAHFAQLTHKTAFLTLLATGCRRSELHAADRSRIQIGPNWDWVTLLPTPNFRAKFQARAPDADRDRHWRVRSLPEDCPHRDKLNCPVRALKLYIQASDNRRRKNHHLFIPVTLATSDPFSANTITSWIKKVLLHAYNSATPELLEKFGVDREELDLFRPAHELRALGPSFSFASSHPALHDILRQCYWERHTVFTRHYLRDVSFRNAQGVRQLAEHVLPGAPDPL